MKLTPESVLHEDTLVKQKKEKRAKKERKFGRKKPEVHTEDVMSEDAVSEEAVSEEAAGFSFSMDLIATVSNVLVRCFVIVIDSSARFFFRGRRKNFGLSLFSTFTCKSYSNVSDSFQSRLLL